MEASSPSSTWATSFSLQQAERPVTPVLDREQLAAIEEVATIAALQAGNALSRLSEISVGMSPPRVIRVKLGEVPAILGGLDTPAIGVLVPFQGDCEGNTLLLFPEEGIRELERIVPAGSGRPDEELRISAFSEMGNILTGTLLTALSSLSEKVLVSLPPVYVQDMAGAILDTILSEVGAGAGEITALVVDLTDARGDRLVRSVLIPGAAGIELLLEAAARLRSGP